MESEDSDLEMFLPSGLSQESSSSSNPPKRTNKRTNRKDVTVDTSSPVSERDEEGDGDNALEAEKVEKEAKRKIHVALIPKEITDPSQLKWQVFTSKGKRYVYPCRLGQRDDIMGLPNIQQRFDSSKKCVVHYLWYTRDRHPAVVWKRQLRPYCGDNDQTDTEWSSTEMEDYLNNLADGGKDPLDVRTEELYLEKILSTARRQAGLEGCDDGVGVNDDPVPTGPNGKKAGTESDTVSTGNESHEKEDQTDDCSFVSDGSSKVDPDEHEKDDKANDAKQDSKDDQDEGSYKTEPIRPGDVIEYTNPMYISGSADGLRTTTVMAVAAREDPILTLQNGDVLPKNHFVKRIAVRMHGKIREHKGTMRPITSYKLQTKKGGKEVVQLGLRTPKKDLNAILNKTNEKISAVMAQHGGPVDFGLYLGTRKEQRQKEQDEEKEQRNGTVRADNDTNDERKGPSTPSTTKKAMRSVKRRITLEPKTPKRKKADPFYNRHELARMLEKAKTAGRSRRGASQIHMTVSQLEVAIQVADECAKHELDVALIADDLEIDETLLKKFLAGDPQQHIRVAKHDQIKEMTQKWLDDRASKEEA